MKTYIYVLLISVITSTVTTGCANKKVQASNRRKQDSIDSNTKLSANSSTKKTATYSSASAEGSDTYKIPMSVQNKFKSTYPTATEVRWVKVPTAASSNKKSRNYKVDFLLDDNQNSIVYTETGGLIETRVQILPEQLPQNIYDAIMEKYPDAKILSASTLKKNTQNGTYTVLINTMLTEKEVILTEAGKYVEY